MARPGLRRRGDAAGKRGQPPLALAFVVVTLAALASLISGDLPRFFWDLGQWRILTPMLIIGTALHLAAWGWWSAVAWLAGRLQGSAAAFRATLAATGLAYAPAVVQTAVLAADLKDPVGVTVAAVVKVTAAALVAVSVVAALARIQRLSWPRAALSGSGWLGIAVFMAVGTAGQVRLFGALLDPGALLRLLWPR